MVEGAATAPRQDVDSVKTSCSPTKTGLLCPQIQYSVFITSGAMNTHITAWPYNYSNYILVSVTTAQYISLQQWTYTLIYFHGFHMWQDKRTWSGWLVTFKNYYIFVISHSVISFLFYYTINSLWILSVFVKGTCFFDWFFQLTHGQTVVHMLSSPPSSQPGPV